MTWAVFTKQDEGRYTLSIVDEAGRDVTSTAAPLVAAAPDLLEALKTMLGIGPPSVHTDFAEMEKACLLALAAIDKAEGREP